MSSPFGQTHEHPESALARAAPLPLHGSAAANGRRNQLPVRFASGGGSRRKSATRGPEHQEGLLLVRFSADGEQLEVRLAACIVELFRRGKRVAAHLRSTRIGVYVTVAAHMPRALHAYAE